jgi:hypothetical protein
LPCHEQEYAEKEDATENCPIGYILVAPLWDLQITLHNKPVDVDYDPWFERSQMHANKPSTYSSPWRKSYQPFIQIQPGADCFHIGVTKLLPKTFPNVRRQCFGLHVLQYQAINDGTALVPSDERAELLRQTVFTN